MGRPGYISIYVDEQTNALFDKFVKEKGITKSEAISEIMEIYMLCKDENLYMKLKKDTLDVERMKPLIDSVTDISSVNDFIFMKLGYAYDQEENKLSGEETIDAYIRNCNENGKDYTWFATDSLTWGMAKKKVSYYNDLIENGYTVQMLFAVGYDDNNEIRYIADVQEIVSDRDAMYCPGDKGTEPNEFEGEKAKIWIKITNIREERTIKAENLRIRSNDSNLKEVITSSQYHFGYVYIPDEE